MFRLILWGLVIWLVIKYALPTLKQLAGRMPPVEPPRDAGAQDTVRCAHCGVYVLRSEARFDGRDYYCSEAHQKQGPL